MENLFRCTICYGKTENQLHFALRMLYLGQLKRKNKKIVILYEMGFFVFFSEAYNSDVYWMTLKKINEIIVFDTYRKNSKSIFGQMHCNSHIRGPNMKNSRKINRLKTGKFCSNACNSLVYRYIFTKIDSDILLYVLKRVIGLGGHEFLLSPRKTRNTGKKLKKHVLWSLIGNISLIFASNEF